MPTTKKSRGGTASGGKKSNIAVSGQSQQALPVAAEQTQPQQTTTQLYSSGAVSLSPDTQGDRGMRKHWEIGGNGKDRRTR